METIQARSRGGRGWFLNDILSELEEEENEEWAILVVGKGIGISSLSVR